MTVLAAIAIIVTAIQKWLAGLQLENLGAGTLKFIRLKSFPASKHCSRR